ncbi:MAG: Uma2 family endonuclease [Eubacterium sp.]|nr:Uma2 family endonuclease [Eubacterium sp.]
MDKDITYKDIAKIIKGEIDLPDEFHEEAAQYNYNLINPNDLLNKNIDDYIKLPEGTRIELIDGRFYNMAAPTLLHQEITGYVFNSFFNHIMSNKGPCKTFISPVDVQLDKDDKTVVQPDVIIVCNKDKLKNNKLVYGAPDLVVEVLSPSNFMMDLIVKKRKYKAAGVQEYWVIVPEDRKTIVHKFIDNTDEEILYNFNEEVPVGIWNDECKVLLGDLELDYE